jgi:pimeloyl-ACP methyl ester carboxylesterase
VLVTGAGFSFDWTLVQTPAAEFTTVCTYDPSGTAWSDPAPVTTCREHVAELHKLVGAAHLPGPFVLTGLSIGACIARLYAALYPSEVAGMVIVDHAFSPDPPPATPRAQHPDYDTTPVLISAAPINLETEQISHFENLPPAIRELHRWAESLHPQRPTWKDAQDCLAQLKGATLGTMRLAVVSTANPARGYERLQSELMALSRNSRQFRAAGSFHAVEIEQPDVVVAAIRRVVESLR